MAVWCTRGVTAALSLILSAGAARSYGSPISVVGGNSTAVGGWHISPERGVPLNVAAANSTGLATLEGDSDVLAPPLDTGIDNSSAQLGAAPATVKYSASQLGANSDWNSNDSSDELLVSADPSFTSDSNSNADLTIQQSPDGTVSEVVNSPLAGWLSLAGLLVVAVLTLKPRKRQSRHIKISPGIQFLNFAESVSPPSRQAVAVGQYVRRVDGPLSLPVRPLQPEAFGTIYRSGPAPGYRLRRGFFAARRSGGHRGGRFRSCGRGWRRPAGHLCGRQSGLPRS